MNRKKIFIIFTFFLIIFIKQNVYSIENKILFKVDNEIITNLDIVEEFNYLNSLNPKVKKLKKDKIFEVSKNSIIREKIKKIEILKNIQEIKIEEKYINKIVEDTYTRLGFETEEDFRKHLEIYKVEIKNLKKKLTIEGLWNELIYAKFNLKIKINKEKIKNDIIKNNKQELRSFDISEIVFNINKDEKLNEKYELIKKDIKDKGFKNTALIYSIASSSSSGGNLGWINENSLNDKLKNEILKLKIGDHTGPIIIPGSFLIIRVNDLKKIKNNINIENEVNKLVVIKTNQQLNQFSNMYFNKIKKDIEIEKF